MGAVIVKLSEGKYSNEDALDKVIPYIMRLNNPMLIGGCGIVPISEDAVIEQFYKVKEVYGMTGGKQIVHIIVSVDKSLRFQEIHLKQLADRMSAEIGKERQVVYAVHNDTNQLHFHMGINTVAYNGTYCDFFEIHKLIALAKKCVSTIVDEVWFHKNEI